MESIPYWAWIPIVAIIAWLIVVSIMYITRSREKLAETKANPAIQQALDRSTAANEAIASRLSAIESRLATIETTLTEIP